MSVILRNLNLALHRDEAELPAIVSRQLRLHHRALKSCRILRRSLDCRRDRKPRYQYTLLLELDPREERRLLRGKRARVERYREPVTVQVPRLTGHDDAARPVVVGAGPAGLFAAFRLTQAGTPPLVIERGPEVTERSRRWFGFLRGDPFDPECNLLFGEGGAGAYSDGKLRTRIKDPRVQEVLAALVAAGAPGEIAYSARPHIGSNLLPSVVRQLRQQLIEDGVEFCFDRRLEGLQLDTTAAGEQQLVGIETSQGELSVETAFLGLGHSARDTLRLLHQQGVAMEARPFQMGVRVEHLQETINRIQYGSACSVANLPPAEYQWNVRRPEGDVFSFCMCPGGEILPASEKAGYCCVNGASPHRRIGRFANSGFVVTVERGRLVDSTNPLAALLLQESVERRAADVAGAPFAAPALRLADFLAGQVSTELPESSYPLQLQPAPFEEFLPSFVIESLRAGLGQLARKIDGFAGPEALVVGPESRSSSSLRMLRDADSYQSVSVRGLYPVGEGAGYAGGIMSAAIDGMRAAEAWIEVRAGNRH